MFAVTLYQHRDNTHTIAEGVYWAPLNWWNVALLLKQATAKQINKNSNFFFFYHVHIIMPKLNPHLNLACFWPRDCIALQSAGTVLCWLEAVSWGLYTLHDRQNLMRVLYQCCSHTQKHSPLQSNRLPSVQLEPHSSWECMLFKRYSNTNIYEIMLPFKNCINHIHIYKSTPCFQNISYRYNKYNNVFGILGFCTLIHIARVYVELFTMLIVRLVLLLTASRKNVQEINILSTLGVAPQSSFRKRK